MTTQRDYYEILGVSKTASVDEIKAAYRKLVMQYHPDRVEEPKKKEAEERFKEISEAYAVLSDPKKKELYDQYGHQGIDSRYSTEDIFRNADFGSIFEDSGFGSIFEDLFSSAGFGGFSSRGGKRGGGRVRERLSDLEYTLSISLEEAATGVERSITYPRHEACRDCNGEGQAKGSSKTTCPACKGYGQVASGMGFIQFSQTCPQCRGAGSIITRPCPVCRGKGMVKSDKTLSVKIPKGIYTGASLRVRGEGEQGLTNNSDLYLHVEVKQHPVFHRDPENIDNIKVKVEVPFTKVILGGDVNVPTLDGHVEMTIPPGTQPNAHFRLKKKGMPNIRTEMPGDEFVEITVTIPKKMSGQERKLIEDYARLRGEP